MEWKFEIASKQTDSFFTGECIYKYRTKTRITIILHNRRGQGKWMSRIVEKFEIEANGRVYGGEYNIEFLDGYFTRIRVMANGYVDEKKIQRVNEDYKILESESLLQRGHFPRSSSINSKANRIEAHPLSLRRASRRRRRRSYDGQ